MANKYELRNVTPEDFDCGVGPCPAIYETDSGTYLIIGKQVNPSDAGLESKVGDDELLVEVPREIIDKRTG